MGVVHTGGLSIEGKGKPCFSLAMYGFCSSNDLYSAGLSFRMLFFFWLFLTLEIITSDQICGIAYELVGLKKHVTLVFSLPKIVR